MAKAQDLNSMMKDMMRAFPQDMLGSFPVDSKAMEDAFKTTATMNEKLSHVALEAAGRSTELSAKWTQDTLTRMSDISKAKAEPSDYARAMTEFASAQAEMTAEHMAAFAEIAKKVQMDTVELMMAAGKDFSEDASAAMKKATDDLTANAKKATTAAAK